MNYRKVLLMLIIAISSTMAQDRNISLTFSPIHLIFPVFEAQVEFMPTESFGISGIFGKGTMDYEVNNPYGEDEIETFSVLEAGMQARYYFSPYKGWHMGAELMYIDVGVDADQNISGQADGVAVGPLGGWKGVWGNGFTMVVQAGMQFVMVKAEATDEETGESASDSGNTRAFLLNFDIGYSF